MAIATRCLALKFPNDYLVTIFLRLSQCHCNYLFVKSKCSSCKLSAINVFVMIRSMCLTLLCSSNISILPLSVFHVYSGGPTGRFWTAGQITLRVDQSLMSMTKRRSSSTAMDSKIYYSVII
jgi:hypothetical protein